YDGITTLTSGVSAMSFSSFYAYDLQSKPQENTEKHSKQRSGTRVNCPCHERPACQRRNNYNNNGKRRLRNKSWGIYQHPLGEQARDSTTRQQRKHHQQKLAVPLALPKPRLPGRIIKWIG